MINANPSTHKENNIAVANTMTDFYTEKLTHTTYQKEQIHANVKKVILKKTSINHHCIQQQ